MTDSSNDHAGEVVAAFDPGSPAGLVVDALRSMSKDPGVTERLALVSTYAQGEEVWRMELIRALKLAGVSEVLREHTTSDVRQIDVVVKGDAFELKSSFSGFAISEPAEKTREWFEKDAKKLRAWPNRGYQLITLATMVDAQNLRFGKRVNRGVSLWERDRDDAVARYTSYANGQGGTVVQTVDLGQGRVPGDETYVQLDALLFCVHDPSL
jgi:hypothetical protein